MFCFMSRSFDYPKIVKEVEIPYSNINKNNDQKTDLAERVFSAALTIIISLGFVLTAVAAGKIEEAVFLGLMGLLILSSYVNPGCKGDISTCGRVIEKRRYYLPLPQKSSYQGRPFIEYPEFKLYPRCHPGGETLDRDFHAGIGKR